jgi:quercetin dioxygenase-like cupin family protein
MSEQVRLRSHPATRFAGDSHVFDLSESLQQLRAEAHPAQSGHRQMTIFHRAPVTQVLFSFDAGGEMTNHAANGLVTIHVLEGHFSVPCDSQTHELNAGMMLVLSPNVRHSVRAVEPGAMLLTVHSEK